MDSKKNSQEHGFDKDFLWIFHQAEFPAVCISLDHNVVALTSSAEKLFAVENNALNGSIDALFARFDLKITFPEKNKNPVVSLVDDIDVDSLEAKKILQLDWKIKTKKDQHDKIAGFIIYAEGQTNIEYLTQIYKAVTGQEELKHDCVKNHAESIKIYLENVIACMPGNVYWMDKNCVYLGCNDNAARFAGLKSRKDAIGLTYKEMEKKAGWKVGQTKLWEQDDLEVIATGKPKLNIEEQPVVMPNGKKIFYLTNRVPLFDNKKNVIGVVGISIDITEHKLIEQKLQLAHKQAEEAEKKLLAKVNQEVTGQLFDMEKQPVIYAKNIQNYFENIIACMPGDIYWSDKNGVCLGCNDNAARFAGFSSRKERIGKTYKDIEKQAGFLAERIAVWERDEAEVLTTGKPKFDIEDGPVILPNGEKIYYLTNRVPLFDDKNNVIGVLGISIDISNRKENERLREEKAVIEKTSHLMKILAGSIAHEIRTPVAIIGINTDLLMMTPEFIAAKNDKKNVIWQCIENMKYAIELVSRIVDNITAMLRTMSVGVTAKNNFERLSIATDVEKMLEVYPFLKYEKSLVQLQLDKVENFVYKGDKVLTQHVLFNLIRNSLQAIKEADKGEIKITFGEEKAYNIVKITDTALGISKELLPKIFEPFETGKMNRSGLGLAFCKVVMESYGGKISCVSKEGKYAEFTLRFPKIID